MGDLKIFTFRQFVFRKLLQDVLQEKKGIHREEDLDLRHWKVAQTSTHRESLLVFRKCCSGQGENQAFGFTDALYTSPSPFLMVLWD